MTEKQKDCIIEIQELMIQINQVVKNHNLQDEFLSVLAVGFVDMTTSYTDDEGDERASMSLMSSFSVTDEEELDDLLSYCVEAYRMEQEDRTKEPTKEEDMKYIDYWIRFANGNGDIN